MKTKSFLWIGALAASIFLLLSTLIDLFTMQPRDPGEFVLNNLSGSQIFHMLLGMIFIFLLVIIMDRRNRKSEESDKLNKTREYSKTDSHTGTMIMEMLSYQLKTSLTTIMGFTKLLKRGSIREDTSELYYEYIYSSSNILLQTYYNLLDIQRINSNNLVVKKEICHIYSIISEAFQKYQRLENRDEQANLSWKLSVTEKDVNLALLNDEVKLKTVLENMLQNAIAFTREGIIEIGYTLHEENMIKFFVKDSGKTAPMEQFEESYLNFSRNPRSLDASFNLAALRMIVAKQFVELMGGKFWSVPNRKRGTTYYFTLPVLNTLDLNVTEESRDEEVRDWSEKTFLIAEDIETNFMLLKELLQSTGARLIWAKNGIEALECYRSNSYQFDLVLLDIIMPELDGFEVASEIRKTNRIIPIIGQTAYTLENEQDLEKLTNFNDFLTKPIWYHDLIKTISRHLG